MTRLRPQLFLLALIVSVLGSAVPAAAADFRLLLDLDNNLGTGCMAVTPGGSFSGIEQILTTTVQPTGAASADVTAVAVETCVAGVFGPPLAVNAPVAPPWPVGVGLGDGASNVIETYLPTSLLPAANADPQVIRLVVVGIDGGQIADVAGPVIWSLAQILEIPTLGSTALLLLAAVLGATAILVLRRRAAGLAALFLLLGATAAWAAVTLDGLPSDWTIGDRLTTDPAEGTTPGADIVSVYAKEDTVGGVPSLAFRIDAMLLFNQPPVAVDDAATVSEDPPGAVQIDVLANDSDPEADPFTIGSVTQPANGTVAITNAGADLSYLPNLNYCNNPPGTTLDTFTYSLTPGGDTATVTVTVTCVDDNPTAVDDAATVAEDSAASTINVLANDTDPDGGTKLVTLVQNPSAQGGTVLITNGGADLSYQPAAGYCNNPPGTTLDTFTYTITGGSVATVTVTVTCVDDLPTAVDDAATVAEDSGANTIDVLANDTDTDGGPMTVNAVQNPSAQGGTVLITNGGADVSYAPAPNYCNTPPGTTLDTFTYTLNGGSVATVTVTVNCVDDPPLAVADSATVDEDSGANAIDVLANDTDIDAGPKLVTLAGPASAFGGTVAITGGGTGLTYAPAADYCNAPPGTTLDTFSYTITGGSSATVTVTVNCLNDGPAIDLDADDDKGTGGADFAVTFNEGDPATLLEDPADATVTDIDSATLQSITITLTNILDTGFEVLDADLTGFPGITKNYDTTTPPTGILTLTGPDTLANFQAVLRTVTYLNSDADVDDSAPRVVQFVANDGTADGNTATSTVTVVPVDTPPTAVADSATVNEDSGANAIDVLANDTDPDGGTKLVNSVQNPSAQGGTVLITGGGTGVTYQPAVDYCNNPPGTTLDTFTYDLTPGGSSTTVTVTVTCVDDNPVAVDDSATVGEDSGANAIDVLANDTDVDGGPKLVTAAGPASANGGAIAITGGGTGLTYAPAADYCNTPPGTTLDTFSYTITGGDTATVTVTVTCVDDNPVAVADSTTVTEDSGANAVDVLANDTDVDGGPKLVTAAGPTSTFGGTVTITGGGTGVTYAPAANYCNNPPGSTLDTFSYTITGGSNTTVTVTVTCVDDPPVAVNDAATVNEDSGANAIDVLANDTDIDAGPKLVTTADPTSAFGGTVTITGGGTGLTYAPAANYCNNPPGTTLDTFNYTITGGSSTTVTVTVTCINDPPVAGDDAWQTIGNTTLAVDPAVPLSIIHVLDNTVGSNGVLGNDSDPVEGDPVSIAACGGDITPPFNCATANGGNVQIEASGAFVFNPKAGDTLASDSFTYTLTDGTDTDTATVTISRVERVWYVQNNAQTGAIHLGDGTSGNPFTTLSDAAVDALANDAEDASLANDWIFVFFGAGTTANQTSGIALKNGQHLLGEHAGLSIPVNLNANGSPTVLHPGTPGQRPLLDDTVAGVPEGVGATDVIPVEIVGLNLAGNVNAIDWTTTGAFAGTGTLMILDNVVRSAGADGVDINLAGTSATSLAFSLNNLTSTLNGLDISETGTGALTIVSFQQNVVGGNTGGAGVVVSSAIFDATPGGGFQQVDGDTLAIGDSGNPVGGAGMVLGSVQGNLFFDDLDIFAAVGTALQVAGTGGGMTFAVTPASPDGSGTSTLDADNGAAVDISTAAIDLRLADLDSNTAVGGLSLNTVSGQFRAPTGSQITKASGGGTAFTVASSGATVNYGGTLNVTSGAGVSLTGNSGATNFSGQLTLSTGANAAFVATGGGTVTASVNTSTITTTTGTPVNIASGTTIGVGGIVLQSVSANGAVNGIILNGTGTNSFLVRGDNTLARNGSGGTINNTSGDAIQLTNANNVTLQSMNLTGNGSNPATAADAAGTGGNHTVQVSGGSNVVLSGVYIDGSDGSGFVALNLGGTNRINNNSRFENTLAGAGHSIYVNNTNTNMTLFELNNMQMVDNAATHTNFFFANTGTSNMTLQVQNNCLFEDLGTQALTVAAGGTAATTGTLTSLIDNNDFQNAKGVGENNVGILVNNGANHVATVSNNTFDNIAKDGTIANTSILRTQNSGGDMTATITGNTIQNIAYAAGSGGRHAIGHVFEPVAYNAGDSSALVITNNTVSNVTFPALGNNREAVFIDYRPTASNGEVTIQGNNFNMPTAGAQQAMELRFRQTNNSTVNVLVRGNTVTHNTAVNFLDIDAEDGANAQVTVDGNNTFTNSNGTPGATVAMASEDPAAIGGPPTMCVSVTGNTLQSGAGTIALDETAGTMLVTQASAAAMALANGIPAGNVTSSGTPTFNSAACTLP